MEMNDVLQRLPRHLLDLVIEQPFNAYTAQDHALWRYVMQQNVRYLGKVAHGSYTEGLKQTGISIDRIPHMYGMNRILKEIGWAAVAVDGFIPPAAFMEFQACNVLVIAADIRPISQIEYTPAPDIIHEAAGHAPIIADPEYAEYLKLFGKIGCKAFSSAADYSLYEAIRHLSILKTNPYTPKDKIVEAEQNLVEKEKEIGELSEMSLIRNLHWWTVEYGLIGDLKKPKIYGAGLLSSIGESINALTNNVKKHPYNIEAKDIAFDITTMQPQLFVTPNFAHLTKVLREFERSMAIKRGGIYGVSTAIESGSDATIVYSSGLQVSGTTTELHKKNEKPVYIRNTGPCTLNFNNTQLAGHDKDHHLHGFGSPVGMIKGISSPPENLSEGDLAAHGIEKEKTCKITFESGVNVVGTLLNMLHKEGKLLLLSFRDCTVKYKDELLFEPEWGVYDMAIGADIISCFNGPADPNAFGLSFPVPKDKTHKIIHNDRQKSLFALYQDVRDMREAKQSEIDMCGILKTLKSEYPEDWLLAVEIYEFAGKTFNDELKEESAAYLNEIKERHPEYAHLIKNGEKL